jgi:NNP family nitrate/nitrite transporter-like MFS transporter
MAYLATFGSELAVVSMLPLFFSETFNITVVQAGLLASGFAFMNLVSRPTGGYFSDKLGRKLTLTICLAGLAVGYFVMGLITPEWFIVLAVLATMCCSFFVQAGEGAVFAVVPLVQRRLTGQIAGMAGAYGNVGALLFLTVLSVVSAQLFFWVIAATALVTLVIVQFMDEPRGQMAEVLPDGTVQMIDVH